MCVRACVSRHEVCTGICRRCIHSFGASASASAGARSLVSGLRSLPSRSPIRFVFRISYLVSRSWVLGLATLGPRGIARGTTHEVGSPACERIETQGDAHGDRRAKCARTDVHTYAWGGVYVTYVWQSQYTHMDTGGKPVLVLGPRVRRRYRRPAADRICSSSS